MTIYRVPLRAAGHLIAAPLIEAADWREARSKATTIGGWLTERSDARIVVGRPSVEQTPRHVRAQLGRP